MKPLTNETLIEEIENDIMKANHDWVVRLIKFGEAKIPKAGFYIFENPYLLPLIHKALQAKERDMIEKFKEIIGEDEDEFEVGFYKGEMIGRVRKTGEEIPLRMELKQADRNELRAYLRSKLSNLSEKK